jgi:hypothetical protein
LNEAEREIVKKLYNVAEEEGWFFSRFGVFTIKIMEESDSLTHWNCSIIYENNRDEELPFAYDYIQQVPIFFYGKDKQGSLQEIEKIALSRLYLKSVKMDRKMPLTHNMFRDGVPRMGTQNKVIMIENRIGVPVDKDPFARVYDIKFDKNGKVISINR